MISVSAFRPVSSGSSSFASQLQHSTLVIPAISIGNIPQFTVDLLIHTFDFVKIGTLDDSFLYPFASPEDHATNKPVAHGVSNAIEVYYSDKLNKTVIQQRSPIIPSFIATHVNDIILPFVVKSGFDKVVILDSSDAGLVEHIAPGSIQVYTNEDLLNKSLESLKLSKYSDISLQETPYEHSSYVRALIAALDSSPAHSHAEVNVLVTYVYEGDNFADSEILANKLLNVLEIDHIKNWTRPISWYGAYGDKPVPSAMEEGLFG
ncbi:hypothetical protein G9P44_004436 [Scheffersomyces stipitis]|nr:hypothetical protein G9P44_004436 [Scheffersomyces stipitis]